MHFLFGCSIDLPIFLATLLTVINIISISHVLHSKNNSHPLKEMQCQIITGWAAAVNWEELIKPMKALKERKMQTCPRHFAASAAFRLNQQQKTMNSEIDWDMCWGQGALSTDKFWFYNKNYTEMLKKSCLEKRALVRWIQAFGHFSRSLKHVPHSLK